MTRLVNQPQTLRMCTYSPILGSIVGNSTLYLLLRIGILQDLLCDQFTLRAVVSCGVRDQPYLRVQDVFGSTNLPTKRLRTTSHPIRDARSPSPDRRTPSTTEFRTPDPDAVYITSTTWMHDHTDRYRKMVHRYEGT